MRKLNIQLLRNGHSTTRRPRWVVWLLGFIFMCLLVIHLTSLWFTRSELLIATPIDTEIAVEMNVTSRNFSKILTLFKNIPVVSHRSLELEDFLQNTKGKFAIFVLKDGTTAIALKTKKEDLPVDLLDENRIVVQKVTNNIVLLSEKLLPLSPIKQKYNFERFIPNIAGNVVGIVTLPKRNSSGLLKISSESISLNLNNLSYQNIDRSMPNETIGFLSTQLLTDSEIENFISHTSPSIQLKEVFTEQSWIFLTKHSETQNFLIWSKSKDEFDRQNFLKKISANLSPNINKIKLADGTIAQEILIDPDIGSIEEITIQGKIFLHSKTQKGEEFFLSKQDDILFSNNEADVRSFLDGKGEETNIFCRANIMGILFSKLLEEEENSVFFSSSSIARNIAQKFSSFGVESNGKSTKINLCI